MVAAAAKARPTGASWRVEERRCRPRRPTQQFPTSAKREEKIISFPDIQTRQLKAKLDAQYVRTRKVDNATLHYIEGWHAIAEANRIFGYGAWDRRTLSARCVWTGTTGQKYCAVYIAKVRIRVRAGDITLKSAETDATKRALTTFGNAFGLALYDAEQAGVRRRPSKIEFRSASPGPWILHDLEGLAAASFEAAAEFAEALKITLASAVDIESLFELWERNVTTVRMPLLRGWLRANARG